MEGLITWVPLLVSGIAAAGTIYSIVGQRQKDKADSTATYQGIADKAAERAVKYETRIESLETRLATMELSIEELEDWAKRLCKQVSKYETPVPRHQRRTTNGVAEA
jgi:predicted RNase H-like nuclease (RuvC/YqgF family)